MGGTLQSLKILPCAAVSMKKIKLFVAQPNRQFGKHIVLPGRAASGGTASLRLPEARPCEKALAALAAQQVALAPAGQDQRPRGVRVDLGAQAVDVDLHDVGLRAVLDVVEVLVDGLARDD